MDDSQGVGLKLISYASDPWNFLDIITIVTYIAGLILRFIPIAVCATCFYASRIVFAFNHMMFCFRILNMFAVHPQLGPKLVMIGRMVRFNIHLYSPNDGSDNKKIKRKRKENLTKLNYKNYIYARRPFLI